MINKVKTYNQALNYLFSLATPKDNKHKPGMHLDRIRDFLEKVGNPQNSYPTIHIGGTSGKGSTSYLTAKLLAENGYTTGIHMSPHLVSLNEKFSIISSNTKEKGSINPLPCTDEELVELVNWFIENSDKYSTTPAFGLTFYEAIISMVFKYFEMKKVDVAVIEVALGGRLDATNVINSDVAVLTTVGLDHTDLLGDTIEKIAEDKMQIMKPGKIFISGVRNENINTNIKKLSQELGSQLKIIGEDFDYQIKKSDLNGIDFKYTDINQSKSKPYQMSLVGNYQAHNATLAITALESFMRDNKLNNNLKLQNTHLKGRFDIISKDPLIILDGAHNEPKMNGLVTSLKKYIGDSEINLLFSCSETKDLKAVVRELSELNIKRIYITQFIKQYHIEIHSYSNEKMKIELQKVYGNKIEIVEFSEPKDAYLIFRKNLPNDRIGLVTGSLYLLGKIYEYLD